MPHLTRPLFSLHPPSSTHHIPPFWRRLVRTDRLNMRPAIPDGTNIIKVRLHAKPVKYRPTALLLFRRPSLLVPVYPADLSVLATESLGILYSSFLFAERLRRLVPN